MENCVIQPTLRGWNIEEEETEEHCVSIIHGICALTLRNADAASSSFTSSALRQRSFFYHLLPYRSRLPDRF